jgi:hypothetical protein
MRNRLVFALTALVLFSATGGSVASAGDMPSDEVLFQGVVIVTLPDPNGSEFAPAFLPTPVNTPDQLIQIWEDPAHTILSDQFYVQANFFYFASDPELQNLTIPVVANLTETGAFQDVGSIFLSTSGAPLFPSGALGFISDVEGVPEPSTLALAGLGVLGVIGYGWSRQRRAQRRQAAA